MVYLIDRLSGWTIPAPANPQLSYVALTYRWVVVVSALTVGVLANTIGSNLRPHHNHRPTSRLDTGDDLVLPGALASSALGGIAI